MKNPKPIGWNMKEVQGMVIINCEEDPIMMAHLVERGSHHYVLKPGGILAVQRIPLPTKGFRIEYKCKVLGRDEIYFIPRIGDMATVFLSCEEAQKALDAYKERFIHDNIEEFNANTKIVEISEEPMKIK